MNILLKTLFSTSIIYLFSFQLLYPQNEISISNDTVHAPKLLVGEEYTYVVKYAFMNLGELRINVFAKDTIDGKIIYKSRAYIDSYEGLPFVDMHQIHESWFDSSLFPVYFQALILNENDTSYTRYFFQNDNSVHVIKGKMNSTKAVTDTVINLDKRFQDGLSLLFKARFNFGFSHTNLFPCYIGEDTSSAIINYYNENENISIDAVNYKIKSLRLDGFANFSGIFGFTGYFEGWFSDDEFHVPLTADVQVLIGDVTLELIDWKNELWQPPAYNE